MTLLVASHKKVNYKLCLLVHITEPHAGVYMADLY